MFLHHPWIQKLFINYSVRRHKLSTSLMATTRTETTHGPTYSMARAIGATAWQNGFICRHHYLRCHQTRWKWFVTWTDLSNGHKDEGYHVIKDGESGVLDRPSFCVMHMSVDFVSYSMAWGSMLSHILMTVRHTHLLHVLHVHALRLAPQCPTFHSLM